MKSRIFARSKPDMIRLWLKGSAAIVGCLKHVCILHTVSCQEFCKATASDNDCSEVLGTVLIVGSADTKRETLCGNVYSVRIWDMSF